MKKSILCALCSIFVFAFSVAAQDAGRNSSARLETLVGQLKSQTVNLAESTAGQLTQRAPISRADIEAAFLARQLDASVGFLQQLLRNGLRDNNLSDAVSVISDLAKRAPNSTSNGNLWRSAQSTISDINREIGESDINPVGNNTGETNNPPPPSDGRVFWRGKVDIETQLFIKGTDLETRVVAGPNWGGEKYSFTASLPTRNVKVEVLKKKGRGTVRVIEQPNRSNDYTAVVQILDPGSSWKEYELEILWR